MSNYDPPELQGPADDYTPDWSDDEPWYRQPGPIAVAALGALVLIAGIVLIAVLATGGDDAGDGLVAGEPTGSPEPSPSTEPSVEPTAVPSPEATVTPETTPTAAPTPTPQPTATAGPTPTPAPTPTPEPTVEPTATATPEATATPIPVPTISVPPENSGFTILDVLAGSDDVSMFLDAAREAGLDTLLDGEEMFTLLVPSNNAFRAADQIDLAMAMEDLDRFVRSHLISGAMTAEELLSMNEVASIADLVFEVNAEDGTIGTAHLVVIDIETDNGIIHVIDIVLLPPVA